MEENYSHSGDSTSEGLSFTANLKKVNYIEQNEKTHILGILIDYHSLSALVESKMIDSSIINAFSRLSLLKASATFPSYHCVATFFSPILRHSIEDATMSFSYEPICKFYKQLKITIRRRPFFSFSKIIIPVHVPNRSHWILMVIDNDLKKIPVYDSYMVPAE